MAIAKQAAALPRTRQVVQIAQRSSSARQAYQSRMMDAEDAVSEAFANRLRNATKDDLKARLYSSLTFCIMGGAIFSWYRGEYQDITSAAKQALSILTRIFCDDTFVDGGEHSTGKSRGPASPAVRKPRAEAKR
jgi:hypothetical protein